MPLILGIGAVAAPVIGGIVGNVLSGPDKDKALALQQQALQNIMNVNTPEANAMRIELQKYSSAGELAPQMEQTIQANPSLMAGVQVDPRLKQAQMNALGSLQNLGQSGLRPEDQAALARVTNQVSQQEQGQEQSALQNAQQRGIAGSGSELAARLASSQGAANRASEQGLDIAGQSSQRALQAIMGAGSLGSQMQGQNFAEDAQKAQAQDVINRYNAMNSQQIAGQNTAVGNAAQAQNLANKQSLMNQNTQLGNQQSMYNAQLPQQQFQNQMSKAGASANALNGMAGNYNQLAGQTQQMFGGIGQGVGQGLAAAGQYGQNQQYMNVLKNKTQPSYAEGSIQGYPSGGLPYADAGMAHGGYVEGGEVVPGDSPENDTIKTNLSAGEMVIPKSIVEEDNPDVIHAFIKGVLAAHNKKK